MATQSLSKSKLPKFLQKQRSNTIIDEIEETPLLSTPASDHAPPSAPPSSIELDDNIPAPFPSVYITKSETTLATTTEPHSYSNLRALQNAPAGRSLSTPQSKSEQHLTQSKPKSKSKSKSKFKSPETRMPVVSDIVLNNYPLQKRYKYNLQHQRFQQWKQDLETALLNPVHQNNFDYCFHDVQSLLKENITLILTTEFGETLHHTLDLLDRLAKTLKTPTSSQPAQIGPYFTRFQFLIGTFDLPVLFQHDNLLTLLPYVEISSQTPYPSLREFQDLENRYDFETAFKVFKQLYLRYIEKCGKMTELLDTLIELFIKCPHPTLFLQIINQELELTKSEKAYIVFHLINEKATRYLCHELDDQMEPLLNLVPINYIYVEGQSPSELNITNDFAHVTTSDSISEDEYESYGDDITPFVYLLSSNHHIKYLQKILQDPKLDINFCSGDLFPEYPIFYYLLKYRQMDCFELALQRPDINISFNNNALLKLAIQGANRPIIKMIRDHPNYISTYELKYNIQKVNDPKTPEKKNPTFERIKIKKKIQKELKSKESKIEKLKTKLTKAQAKTQKAKTKAQKAETKAQKAETKAQKAKTKAQKAQKDQKAKTKAQKDQKAKTKAQKDQKAKSNS